MSSRGCLVTLHRNTVQHFVLPALSALALAAWGCRGEKVAPQVPQATGPWVDSLPPIPTSYIDVPVRYDLAPALRWLEAAVPLTIGDLAQRQPIPGKKRMHYAFTLKRRPFRVKIAGRTASIVAVFQYQGRAWYDPPILPEISGSCGIEGERPRARLVVVTNVELTDKWTLQPRTRALAEPLTHTDRDQCKVTVLRINVTEKALGAARQALQTRLTKFDRRLARFDLRREAQKVWDVLRSPLRLTDSLWLTIEPSAVRIGLLTVQGDTLVTTVGLSAKPRIVGGPRPPALDRAMPPPQDSATRPPVLHLLTEARMPYNVASVVLTQELKGTKIRVGRRRLVIQRLQLLGVGDGRVAVGLGVTGPVEGTLYAVGRPAFDTATAVLFMPDLTYDIGTRNMMVGTLSWLGQGTIEEFLRTRVRIKMAHVIEQGRALLEQNLNRELVPGVRLRTTVHAGRMLGVRAAPDALLARAVVSGHGELVLELQPEVPPPRLRKRLGATAR